MKEVKLSHDLRSLIDSDGIIFKKPKPLATIEVKISTANLCDTRIDIKKDFPDANAYLNLGPIPEKIKIKEREHEDPDIGFIHTSYRFYKVELYHLGE